MSQSSTSTMLNENDDDSLPPYIRNSISRMPDQLKEKLEKKFISILKENRPIRVYCDGVFDTMHYGHAQLFKQVKELHPNIIVVAGICKDEDVLREKGQFVMNEKERIKAAEACKWVDEVQFPAPWYPSVAHLRSVDCDFTAHDAEPYMSLHSSDSYMPLKEAGMFIPTQKIEGVCTTEFISRVIKHKDQYIERSLNSGVEVEDLKLNLVDKVKLMTNSMVSNIVSLLFCQKKLKDRNTTSKGLV